MRSSVKGLTWGALLFFLLIVETAGQTTTDNTPLKAAGRAAAESPFASAGAATTTSLASSSNPSTFGGSLTLTATVSPSAASGSVAFYDGTLLLGSSMLMGGKATLTTILLPAGTQSLRAYYLGGGADSPSTSPVLTQSVDAAAGSGFAAPVNYGAGVNPDSIAIGDFNGDGKADMAVTNYSDSDVSILLGRGDGTFQPAANYSTARLPYSVAVGDFDGDGHQDLAVANVGANSVGVLLGNGDGTFQTQVEYSGAGAMGSGPVSVAVADINGDGYADIVAVTATGLTSVYLGSGGGGFAAPLNYGTAAVYPTRFAIGVGDFNGDGKPDLAVVGYGSLNILPGNGDGTFQSAIVTPISAFALSIAITDLNGDGKTDVAIPSGSNVSVLLGNGDGTFQRSVNYPVSNAYGIAIGDFNGDGIPDLVATVFNSGALSGSATVFLGNGDGAFQTGAAYAVGNSPYALAVGDFNGDGTADIAVANNASTSDNVSVLLGISGTKAFQTITFGALNNLTYGVAPFTISATASSGLAVSLTSTTPGVCTVAGTTVSIVGGGLCSIVASQAGNATYAAASVTQGFTVSPASQTIAFPAINDLGVGVIPFTVAATASSGLPVSLASTTGSVCSVSGATVTLLTAGTCTIQATQTGNANYAAAMAVSRSFAVSQYSPCDIKQTGSISVADVQLIINEALGAAPPVNDLAGTGVINVVAVQIEINAALGLGCAAR
jgi:hypothetical protein